MALSFGPFFTCFIVTLFLTVYLHIIMHHTSVFHKRTIQFSLIGILVILIRMSIPFNFPFTYSFQSYQVLPRILDFTTQNIAGCRLRVDTLIFSIWFTVAFILLLRLLVQYIRLHHALSAFFVEKEGAYKVFIAIRGCRTKQLVRSLFSMKKYSRASKSPAVGVKYKYAKTYIFT